MKNVIVFSKYGSREVRVIKDGKEVDPSQSRKALQDALIEKTHELQRGVDDFNRLRIDRQDWERVAAIKNYNRGKVDGEWVSVVAARSVCQFLASWSKRREQLEWEIKELRKLTE